MFKKLLSMVLCAIMVLGMGTIAFAAETTGISTAPTITYNVSPVEPTESYERGVSIPTDTWDVTSKGTYSFSGSSNYQNLYTSYLITGKDSYSVTVNNNSDYDLTVLVKTRFNTFSENKFAAGTTSTYNVTGMDKDSKIYILFKGSYQDFSGTIG